MFTRVVKATAKNGKARELCNTINQEVLPILRKQNGFVDEITLISNTDNNQVLALSFWKSRDDADRYHRDQFNHVNELISQLIDTVPSVNTYEVDTSTTHRIASGKAA
jgi:heme-degrading monooxygenase HmoA